MYNGKLHGKYVVYTYNKKLFCISNYKHDELNGINMTFDGLNNRLIEYTNYFIKNKELQLKRIVFGINNNAKMCVIKISYSAHDESNGNFFTYFSNGNLETFSKKSYKKSVYIHFYEDISIKHIQWFIKYCRESTYYELTGEKEYIAH
jgi:antitoxin component YwqK of YwqJK toxin-antitoxin module